MITEAWEPVLNFKKTAAEAAERQNMNGIDISSNQGNINVYDLDADFVIVKATQDTAYTNPQFTRCMEEAIRSGKLVGCYHYAGGWDPIKEAKHFLSVVEPYIGKAILCLDWEDKQNASFREGNDDAWCKKFLDYVHEQTGVTGFLYISHSYRNLAKTTLVEYRDWIARYPDYNRVNAYKEHPWAEDETPCDIRQYTSQYWPKGYWSNVDADKAYISSEEWLDLASGSHAEPPAADVTDAQAATEAEEHSYPLVRYGDRGHIVKIAQTFLILCGKAFQYGADGIYGDATLAAVKEWQRENNLVVDGVIGDKTWSSMLGRMLGW